MISMCMPANGPIITVLIVALTLGSAGAAGGQEIATLTDASGTVMKLQTFAVSLSASGDLRFRGWGSYSSAYFRGHRVYEFAGLIPIRQTNGAILFVTPDSIKAFQSDGKQATVTLTSGDRLSGFPLPAASIKGQTALGEVSIPLSKVRNMSINTESAKKHIDGEEEEFWRRSGAVSAEGSAKLRAESWPARFKSRAELYLVAGGQLSMASLALITEWTDSGCDDSYVPCKPYSGSKWELDEGIPIRYGTSDAKLPFSKAQSIILTPAGKPGIAASLSISLRSGDRVTATIGNSDIQYTWKGKTTPIAFLGTTSYGFAHVPIDRVKQLTFAEQ